MASASAQSCRSIRWQCLGPSSFAFAAQAQRLLPSLFSRLSPPSVLCRLGSAIHYISEGHCRTHGVEKDNGSAEIPALLPYTPIIHTMQAAKTLNIVAAPRSPKYVVKRLVGSAAHERQTSARASCRRDTRDIPEWPVSGGVVCESLFV
jgi:hypothetical protein